MLDILLLTLPKLELRTPPSGLAILKAVAQNHGFTATCLDLNVELWHEVKPEAREAWMESSTTLIYDDTVDEFWNLYLKPLMPKWIDHIKKLNPRWLGVNVFFVRNKPLAKKFCAHFKEHLPDIKIVLGGPGMVKGGNDFIQEGLADHFVMGEGEFPIVNILKGDLVSPGINDIPDKQIDDLSYVPIPDYSDYDLTKYSKHFWDPRDMSNLGTNILYISGSRGCIRKCSFCDIQKLWPKFRYRDGESLAEEMKIQENNHGIKIFQFTDSLVNGSVKQLRNLTTTLIDNYKEKKMEPIGWEGQFIIRPERQMPEDVWADMAASGCRKLLIGIESGSDNVRKHMNKMFTEEDVEFNFKMCEKYNIHMVWLMLIGYPTETDDDFNETLSFFRKYHHIKHLVDRVQLGSTLEIGFGSPLYKQQKELGIWYEKDQSGREHWRTETNTREIRLRRWIEALDVVTELDYIINDRNVIHFQDELNNVYGTGIDSMGPSA